MTVQLNASKAQQGGNWNSDVWGMVELWPGDLVYGGWPGQGIYYTDAATVGEFGLSRAELWDALQVPSHPVRGLRELVAEYRVVFACCVPGAYCRRNATYGSGGGWQYMISDYLHLLQRTGRGINLDTGALIEL